MLKGNGVDACNLCKALCEACVQRLDGVSSVTELSDSACVCVYLKPSAPEPGWGEACGEPQNEAFIRELCKASNDF